MQTQIAVKLIAPLFFARGLNNTANDLSFLNPLNNVLILNFSTMKRLVRCIQNMRKVLHDKNSEYTSQKEAFSGYLHIPS